MVPDGKIIGKKLYYRGLSIYIYDDLGKQLKKELSLKTLTGKVFLLIVLLSFIFGPLQASTPLHAQLTDADIDDDVEETHLEESIEITAPSGARDDINFNIFEDIARARAMLEKASCGFKVVRPKFVKKVRVGKKGKKRQKYKTVVTYGKPELGEFAILLAVENVPTREIKIVRVHPRLGARTQNAVIEPGKANGVNTKFTIVSQEHHVVLALKRPVRSSSGFKEVIYTPYSEGIDIPIVRKAGLDYLRTVIDNAKNDLIRRRVNPRSCDSFIDNDISVVLAIIEHIDPGKFLSGKYTPEKLINETLVILGTNRDHAYRYSRSKAGAMGLFQFIPGTYKRILNLYPRAGLNRDFVRGMEDHENAAKASFLLFDADMHVLNDARRQRLLEDPPSLGRFLASAYNCGPGRTRGSMERHGDNWTAAIPSETQTYLHKFDATLTWYRTEALLYR
ncbi:MAG: transglycosylase SLT domain-containing protein [Syntrophorhabdaceae bacterium]|nr:transglycosylase SLT domain-containing protein [Syntrophorhabdaceae bacterium]